jgi:hypothetical protein
MLLDRGEQSRAGLARSPRRRQPLLPVRDGFLCRSRLRGAASHGLKLLVVAGPAGRDDRQPPGMQELSQPPIADRIMRCVHGLVVLAEELAAFLLRQVPENDLRIIRILELNRLSGHASNLHPGSDAGPWLRAGCCSRPQPPQFSCALNEPSQVSHAVPYDGSVAYAVTAVPGTRQLVGEGWSLRAERIEMLQGNDWRAVIGVRRGLKLLVTWSDHGQELDVEAWTGEPEQTDGVAVVGMEDGDIRLTKVPLCSCGERGCGNAGIQLSKWLPGEELPALIELLRELPWTKTIPIPSNVLRGSGLAAIEGLDTDAFRSAGSYLYAPGTGEIFPARNKE